MDVVAAVWRRAARSTHVCSGADRAGSGGGSGQLRTGTPGGCRRSRRNADSGVTHMTRTIQASIATFALVVLAGSGAAAQAPAGFELALVDVDGTKTVLGQLPPTVYAPRVSPDGSRVVFETRDQAGPDGPRLWIAALANIAARKALPIVAGPINWAPMWTPDGQRLVFIVSGERGDAVYWRPADG